LIELISLLVKVQRCVSSNEEWRLTNTILLTTTDNSLDREIVQEQILWY